MSQPQISGGSISTSGGTSHNGIDTTSASTASSVEPSDQSRLTSNEPPCLRSRVGKRRCPTRSTMVGVMNIATSSRHNNTITGVASTNTNSGANTVRSEPMPMRSSQPRKVCTIS